MFDQFYTTLESLGIVPVVVLDKVESFQDRVDKMFEDDEEDEPAKTADKTSDSTQTTEKDKKPSA